MDHGAVSVGPPIRTERMTDQPSPRSSRWHDRRLSPAAECLLDNEVDRTVVILRDSAIVSA